mmetsp:Transcript_25606/g.35192  ORF Transcript_25606/g.35192 Transcript_25606/m.35192 type:complete len:105 (+) Transcript_25606:169-483(+)
MSVYHSIDQRGSWQAGKAGVVLGVLGVLGLLGLLLLLCWFLQQSLHFPTRTSQPENLTSRMFVPSLNRVYHFITGRGGEAGPRTKSDERGELPERMRLFDWVCG